MPRAFYDPSNPSTTTVYRVANAGDPFFVPAYPTLNEEQKVSDPHFSLNGIRTNLEDGTNGPEPRREDTSVNLDATEAAAYKAAALAQCQKIASKQAISATGVDPATVNFQLAEGVATDD